jgi:hypothetical protein
MKNIFLNLSLTFAIMSVCNVTHADSKFSRLINVFNQGTVASAADINGVFSGRCYYRNFPDEALPGLLVAAEINGASADGPMFSPSGAFKILRHDSIITHPSNLYDSFTSEVEKLINVARSEQANVESVKISGGSLVSEYSGILARLARKSGPYVVVEINNVLENQTDEICYYFKKIKSW